MLSFILKHYCSAILHELFTLNNRWLSSSLCKDTINRLEWEHDVCVQGLQTEDHGHLEVLFLEVFDGIQLVVSSNLILRDRIQLGVVVEHVC